MLFRRECQSVALALASSSPSDIIDTTATDPSLQDTENYVPRSEFDELEQQLQTSYGELKALTHQNCELKARAQELAKLEERVDGLRQTEHESRSIAEELQQRVAELEHELEDQSSRDRVTAAERVHSHTNSLLRTQQLLAAKLQHDLETATEQRQQARFDMIEARIRTDEHRMRMIESEELHKHLISGLRTELLTTGLQLQSLQSQVDTAHAEATEQDADHAAEVARLQAISAEMQSTAEKLERVLGYWQSKHAQTRALNATRECFAVLVRSRNRGADQQSLRARATKWSMRAVLQAWK